MLYAEEPKMRTTLAIDDDVLAAAKEMATSERKSLGEVISALAWTAASLKPPRPQAGPGVQFGYRKMCQACQTP
jgi:hypothetical protein